MWFDSDFRQKVIRIKYKIKMQFDLNEFKRKIKSKPNQIIFLWLMLFQFRDFIIF